MSSRRSSFSGVSGFTLVEIVFVLVIIGIIATMVTNPGLLRQKDSVTSQKNSNLLSSFIDQRKLDMFLGKKLGDMYVETLEIRIQPDLAQELLLLTYTLAPSRSSDSFDGFLPSDNNLTYFLHSQDFRCTIREQHDLKVVLVCGFQEHIADFISMDMITCSKDGSDSSPLSGETVILSSEEIRFFGQHEDVRMIIRLSYKDLFARRISWDRRTGVVYELLDTPNELLTCDR